MNVNRNRVPRISTVRNEDISDSYVSRNEVRGIFDNIDIALDAQSKIINEHLGLDHTKAPKTIISKITDSSYLKFTNIDPAKTVVIDSSLSIDSIVSHSISNDVIGVIKEQGVVIDDSVLVGIDNRTCSKVTINPVSPQIHNEGNCFNPYYDKTLSDTIKAFKIGSEIYHVTKSGSIIVEDLISCKSRNFNTIDVKNIYGVNNHKSISIFNDIQYGEVVINASYDGDDKIYIITTNNVHVFNITTKSSFKDFNLSGRIILDIISKGNYVYFIELDNNVRSICRYMPSDEYILEFTISNRSSFGVFDFNALNFLDNGVVVFDRNNRFSTNMSNRNITYIVIPDNHQGVVDISNYTVNNTTHVLEIEFIVGSTTNLNVGLVTGMPCLFDRTIVNIVGGVVNAHNNRYTINKSKPYSNVIKYGNYILTTDGIDLSVIKIVNGVAISVNNHNLGNIRNVGKIIENIEIINDELSILFDDNTVTYYPINEITSLNNENVSILKSNRRLEFKVNDKIIRLTNKSLEIINNNDLSTYSNIEFSNFMNDTEFNTVFASSWFAGINDSINVVILTKTFALDGITPATRVSMIQVFHGEGNQHIEIVNNEGWTTNVLCCSSDIQSNNGRMFIPIKGTDGGFLIVCDFSTKTIIYNNMSSSNYTLKSTISDDCSIIKMGIDGYVYDIPINSQFYTKIGSVRTFTVPTLTSLSLSRIEQSLVKCDKVYFVNNSSNEDLFDINNSIIYNGEYSKFYPFEDYYISINNKFVKIYRKYDLKLVCIKSIKTIFNINSMVSIIEGDLEFIINFDNITIFVNVANINDTLTPNVNVEDRLIDSINNAGIFVTINSSNCLNIIDTVSGKNYVDFLNIAKNSLITPTVANKVILNSVDRYVDKIYLSTSLIDNSSGFLLSHMMFIIDDLGVIVTENFGATSFPVKFNDVKYVKTIILNGTFYVLYYDNGLINGYMIANGLKISINSFYKYRDFTTPLSMSFFFSGRDCKLQIVSHTDAGGVLNDSVELLTNLNNSPMSNPVPPTTTCVFKVIPSTPYVFIVKIDTLLSQITCMNHMIASYTFSSSEIVNWYNTNRNNIGIFIDNFDVVNFAAINDSTNMTDIVSMKISTGELNKYITNCFRLFSDHNPLIQTVSNKFIDSFTNGAFIAFNNKPGLVDVTETFEVFGTHIINLINGVNSYHINTVDCICDRTDINSIRSVSFTDGIFRNIVSSDLNNSISKTLNYTVDSTNRLIQIIGGTMILQPNGFIANIKLSDLGISIDGETTTLQVNYVKVDNNSYILNFRKNNSIFGFRGIYQIFTDGSYYNLTNSSNVETKLIVFGDGVTHLITKGVTGNTYYNSLVNKLVSSPPIDILNFTNVTDTVGIIVGGVKCIVIFDKSGKIGIFNMVTKDLTEIQNPSSCISGLEDGISNVYSHVAKVSNTAYCSVIIENTDSNTHYMVCGCKLGVELDINGNYVLSIDINQNEKLVSVNLDNINRFSAQTFNEDFGLCDGTVLNDGSVMNLNSPIEIDLGKIDINKTFVNFNKTSTIHKSVPVNTSIPPKLFLGDRRVLLQYHNCVEIYEFDKTGGLNVLPLYTIYQPGNIYKTIIKVVFSDNRVLMQFSDNSCCVLEIPKYARMAYYVDANFDKCLKYDANRNDNITYFVNDYGVIGFYTSHDVYIYDVTSKTFIMINGDTKFTDFCYNSVYNRIYTVDTNNVFGYVDILEKKYISVRPFYGDKIISLYNSVYNTIEIYTNGTVYSYFNNEIFEVDGFKQIGLTNNLSTIVHGIVDYTVI